MSLVLFLLALSPAATASEAKPKDPVVCTRSRERSLGTNIAQPRVCKRKSEWDEEARNTKRELQQANQRGNNPFKVPGGQPIPQ